MDDDTTRTIGGPQGTLRVRVDRPAGEGSPVLLLHSDAGRLQQWDEVVDASADEPYGLARFDFRGHGDSEAAADADYSFDGRAEDILAVLDALGWDRAVLVAHSGGNGPAVVAVTASPGRFAALVMVDPPTDSSALPEAMKQQFLDGYAGDDSLSFLQDYYRSIAGSDPAVVDRVLADAAATTSDARAGLAPALLSWSPDLLDGVALPLSVLGTDITDGPTAIWARRPDLLHRVVHGTGHWLNIERPDEVVADIRARH